MPRKKKKFKGDPAALRDSFSKNLLGLKFMQRSTKVAEKDLSDTYQTESSDDEDEGQANEKDLSIQIDASTIQKLKTHRKCIINPSYQFCEKLKFGRLSFKGMNTEVEAIMWSNSGLEDNRSTSNLDSSSRTAESGAQKRPADRDWDDDED